MDNKILGYARVSSEEQAQHGISVDAQRTILEGYAAMTSSTIQIYEDAGYSGKNTNRPALQQLLAACRSGSVSAVVVWKLDRLSRSLRDTLTIIEDVFQPRGITLVSVTESIDTSTPSGRMMLNLLASFAQLEREQDSDRVVMAHKHLARDCKYLGGHIPYGYTVNAEKQYQLDPATAPMIRHVFDLYRARSGYTSILEYLNHPDRLPLFRRKSPFTKPVLFSMLSNEIYSGVYVRRMGADPRHRVTSPETIRVPGGVPAILTPEEWCQVESIRAENKTSRAMYTARTIYPLSGLVFCASCGNLMHLNYGGKDRNGTPQRYYTCRQSCCRPARLEQVQSAVFEILQQMAVSGAEITAAACAVANQYAESSDRENAAEARAIDSQITEINKKIARIVSFIAETESGAPASLADDLRRLESDREKLKSRAAALRRPSSRYDPQATCAAINACKDIKKQPPDQQKSLCQAAVYKVTVSADEFKILFNWHTCGGDEPPRYVCQSFRRPVR